jgi:hypothetical protein
VDERDGSTEDAEAIREALTSQLTKGVRQLEELVLEDFAQAQMAKGNVTVANKHRRCDDATNTFDKRLRGLRKHRARHRQTT